MCCSQLCEGLAAELTDAEQVMKWVGNMSLFVTTLRPGVADFSVNYAVTSVQAATTQHTLERQQLLRSNALLPP